MQIAVSSSVRNNLVGFGGVIEKQIPRYKLKLKTFLVTLGAESILRGTGSDGTRIEHTTRTQTV